MITMQANSPLRWVLQREMYDEQGRWDRSVMTFIIWLEDQYDCHVIRTQRAPEYKINRHYQITFNKSRQEQLFRLKYSEYL